MAYNRFAKRRTKTPFGKVVVEKKKKKAKVVAKIVNYRIAFCLMTIPEGEKPPSDEKQLEFVKASIKSKDIFTKILFCEVPVLPRTIVFRLEKWVDSGDFFVSRPAKSVYSAELSRYIYVSATKPVTWKLK